MGGGGVAGGAGGNGRAAEGNVCFGAVNSNSKPLNLAEDRDVDP